MLQQPAVHAGLGSGSIGAEHGPCVVWDVVGSAHLP